MGIGSSFSQKYKVDKADDEFDKYDFIDAHERYLEVINEGYDSAKILKKLGILIIILVIMEMR